MAKQPKKNDWMTTKWRPMMAIMYMSVCIFDFILFPIMFTAVQFWEMEAANDAFRQWAPITLGGGGLFHVAMGAVLGVTAWSRGKEKLAGVAGVSQQPEEYIEQRTVPIYSGMSHRLAPSTGEVRVGYGGRLAPPDSPQPLI